MPSRRAYKTPLDKIAGMQYYKSMTEMKKNNKTYQKPIRFFEKSGDVNPESSYYVALENVVNSDTLDIKTMVDYGRYFSIFAPRQSGKTTFFKRLCHELHKDRTT